MKRSIISIVAFFVALNFSLSQSIDQLVEKAYQNNLELKILNSEFLAAMERPGQVSQLPDPEFGLGVFPLPVETRLGGQFLRLSGNQMFPWKGTLDKKETLELSKARVLSERIGLKKLEIRYSIKKAFLKLYEIDKTQSFLLKNIKILESLRQIVKIKSEIGKSNAADVLMVQLKIDELSQRLLILKNEKDIPGIEINQLLNQDVYTPIEITDSLDFTTLIFIKDSLSNIINANHPMVKMFNLQQEVSRNAIALSKISQKPSFGAGLDYIFVNQRSDAQPDHNGRDILQVKASIKIPIYKKKFESKEREENLKIEALEFQKENLLSQYRAKIDMAYSKHQTLLLQKELYEKQIETTTAAINILTTTYSAKGERFDEIIRLINELNNYDLKLLKLIVESHLIKNEIEVLLNYNS